MSPPLYYSIGAGPLFRVASATSGNIWPAPLSGAGAYFTGSHGNRYSGPDQLTVYCAEDPLVAITEGAYYQAMEWQNALAHAHSRALSYPFRSTHLLWAFQIAPPPVPVVDLESDLASQTFGYSPQVILNPSRVYSATQDVARLVRGYTPPAGSGLQRPEGLKAPSVRTPYLQGFQPHQLALFVRDLPGAGLIPFAQRSTLLAKMSIEFEFLSQSTGASVTYSDARIDWSRPKFKVAPIPGEASFDPVPAFTNRPGANVFALNQWHSLEIVF